MLKLTPICSAFAIARARGLGIQNSVTNLWCRVLVRWSLLFLMLLTNHLVSAEPPREPSIQYILYLRPGGALGRQLDQFWTNVKKSKLNDPAVLKYPPHCSLTGFFPGTRADEETYVAALRGALDGIDPIFIEITERTIHQGPKLDYIPLESSDLLAITTQFVKLIGISKDYIKGQRGTFGYHISLREDTDPVTTTRVRKLEKQYINLRARNLKQNTTWALYLYRKQNNQLVEVVKIPFQG